MLVAPPQLVLNDFWSVKPVWLEVSTQLRVTLGGLPAVLAVAVKLDGVAGLPLPGLTALDGADAGPVPTMLVAFTVNVYVVPFFSPFTVIGLGVAPNAVPVKPPGLEVAVYPIIGVPPSEAGAEKVTVAEALPPTATTPVGAPGRVIGVTLFEGAEGTLFPAMLVATTVNVYGVPFVRPVMVWVSAVVPALVSTPPPGLDVTV